MSRIKIDIKGTTFEAEGEESFVKAIFEDFKDNIRTQLTVLAAQHAEEEPSTAALTSGNATIKPAPKNTKTKNPKRKESYSIIKDLNLLPAGKDSLRDFYAKKGPATAMEQTAVFVYYLKRILEAASVGVNHVYTCYKAVGERVPGALKQNVADTSSRKGYIDTKNFDDIQLTIAGENFVEHELPKPVKEIKND